MIFGNRLKAGACCSKCACSALKQGTRKRTAWKRNPCPKRTGIRRNCRMTMRIFYTLTCWIFTALLAFAQQPPEPPIVVPMAPLPPMPPSVSSSPRILLAPLAPLPPLPPLPPDFADLPLLAFQDSQRDNDRNARREQEQLRRLQESSSESYSRGKSYLDRKEYDRAI